MTIITDIEKIVDKEMIKSTIKMARVNIRSSEIRREYGEKRLPLVDDGLDGMLYSGVNNVVDVMMNEYVSYATDHYGITSLHNDKKLLNIVRKYAFTSVKNAIKRGNVKTYTFYVSLKHKADWEPGEFGDRGSCWWGSKSQGRNMLYRNNGYAIKLYDGDKNPIARLWAAPYDNNIAIFNMYNKYNKFDGGGLLTLNNAAIIIGNALNYKFSILQYLLNKKKWNGKMHINRGYSFIIGEGHHKYANETIDLNWAITDFTRCGLCGKAVENENEMTEYYYHYNDEDTSLACDRCAEKYLDMCLYDFNIYRKEYDMVKGPDNNMYHIRNIEKIDEFVIAVDTGKVIYKKDAIKVGNLFFKNKTTCKECSNCGDVYDGILDRCSKCITLDQLNELLADNLTLIKKYEFSLPEDSQKIEDILNNNKHWDWV